MTKRPYTDLHDLVKQEVCDHIKPFIVATMHEHEETRKKITEAEKTFKSMNKINIHDIIQYAAILLLFIGVTLGLSTCA